MASPAPTSASPANEASVNGGGGASGLNGAASAAPVAIGGPSVGGHSRKGSLMVGGPGADGKRGSLAFGTVDQPNTHLSSSPAAPSVTGQHLADNVKSFGTIDADAADPNSIKPPSRRTSGANTPMSPNLSQSQSAPRKEFNMHAAFAAKQPMQQQPQLGQPQLQQQQQHPGQYQQFRPPQPGPVRSPVMQNALPSYPTSNFRPPQNMQQMRPNGIPVRPYIPQGYQQQQPYMYQQPPNFYPGQYPGYEQQQPYGMQQQQQWPPQNVMSPRGPPSQLAQSSPIPQPNQLPGSNGPSPVPTPPVRPPHMIPQLPSTPSRPTSMSAASPAYMSGAAPAFTPRASTKAIKFSRDDGTAVDIKDIAAAAKSPSPAVSSGVATPDVEPPKKPLFNLPVIVRLETPDQKNQRLKEEAEAKKIKEVEAKEEAERKERKERQAREAEEKRIAEEKRKEDEAKAAEEAKAAAAKEAEEKAIADKHAADLAIEKAKEAESVASSPVPSSSATFPKSRPSPIETVKASPLSTAKPIDDLASIKYPDSLNPPSPALNTGSEPGKFRYDRDFLMQFMQYCKEKPDGLPPLEDIGLEAESSSSFGRRGSKPPRGTPSLGGAGRSVSGMGMGSFGTGNFGGAGTLRGSTSEERFRQSQRGMARTPSQGGLPGMHGLPMMGSSTSRSGMNRSQRGSARRPPAAAAEPEVAPLQVSNNSWVKARPTDQDERSPAFVERKVKGLLNKLTAEKFDSISRQILEWANKSRDEEDCMSLKLVIKLVFDKATDESHWSSMYARQCQLLHEELDSEVKAVIDGKEVAGRALVRKFLIGRCQMDFESGWREREEAAAAAAAKSEEDKKRLEQIEKDKAEGKEEGEVEMLSDEYYAAQKAKRRGLGLVQLIGELYKLGMISRNVIRSCFMKLLGESKEPDEDDLESSCKLLATIGREYDAAETASVDMVFARLDNIAAIPHLASRLRFMILDLKDLRAQQWVSKKTGNSVMTIAEVHKQAAQEQAKKAAANRESISRGGSKTGHRRDQPGEWQSVAPAARLPQRPVADMSRMGGLSTGSGQPSFGPSSVFNRKKSGAATPPSLSRQQSSANMFSALENDQAAAAESEAQRPKLNLKPRTKPLIGEGEEGEGEVEEAEDNDEEEDAAPAPMGEQGAKTKIDSDMKELWGEKDQGGHRNPDEIVEYFNALPEEHRGALAERLFEDIFRISKVGDAEIVAKGYSKAKEAGIPVDVLRKGLDKRLPELDDDSLDFPGTWKSVALVIRALGLEDESEAMMAQVRVEYASKIGPLDHLKRAFGQIDA